MRLARQLVALTVAAMLVSPLASFAAKPPPPPPANPIVSSISSYGQEPGTSITIIGSGFGPKKLANYPVFGGDARGIIQTWTDTMIVAKVPQSAIPGYVGVMVDGVMSNGFWFVPGVPPQVTSVSARGADVGTQVTLTGGNFGATQGIGWVTFAHVSAQVVSWSDAAITVVVPAGAPPGYIGVWQNAICSNGLWFVPGGVPQVDGLSKNPALVGDTITLNGADFGAAPEAADSLTLGGQPIAATSWSDTQITFQVPVSASSGYLGVSRAGATSNGAQLLVGARVTDISSWTGEPGTDLTITGEGFGSTADRVTMGGADATVVSWTPTRIVATIPQTALEGHVGVWRGSVASNGIWFLPAYRPRISSVTPAIAKPGDTVTVVGTAFGAVQDTSLLKVAGATVQPSSWSDTQITFSVSETMTAGYVGVSKRGLASNGVSFAIAPRITSLSSWWGEPGSTLTITGLGFLDAPDRVTIGGVDAPVVSWTPTQIVVTVPADAVEGTVGVWRGSNASNGIWFLPTYKPVVSSVTPAMAKPGDTVTVTGLHFGATQDSSIIKVGSNPMNPSSWSDTQITFSVPETLTAGYVGVSKRGLTSNGVQLLVAPKITALSSWWGARGTNLTITGLGFLDAPDRVTIGGVDAPVVSWTPTQIVVTIPADAVEGNVGVWRGTVVSNGMWFLPTTPPKITSVTPATARPGDTVTVVGTDFGATQGVSTLKLGSTLMVPTSWSDTRITFTVSTTATTGYLGVTRDGLTSNGAQLLVGAKLTSLSSWWGEPNTNLTIKGTGFLSTADKVTIGGIQAPIVSWTATQVVVTIPATAVEGNVVLWRGSVPSNGIWFLPTYKPVISSLSAASAPRSTNVTITGSAFGATQGSSTVKVGSVALTVVSWSDTQIVATIPAAAASGYVGVTKRGISSNGKWLTVN